MIKNILAVAIVVALSACSSSSDSGNDDGDNVTPPAGGGGDVTPPAGGGVTPPAGGGDLPIPVGGGEGPVTATKAGTYVGTLGFADGVYVIDNENRFAGLAIAPGGSAQSLFGDLDAADTFQGPLRQYLHDESRLSDTALSFGSTAGVNTADLEIDVNIVNGQSIESTAESATAVMLLGSTGSSLAPANAEQLAGTWSGANSFCNVDADGAPIAGECNTLTTQLIFNGTSVEGSTTFNSFEGGEPFVAPLVGGITDFGDVALIEFNWNGIAGYSGLVFFTLDNNGDIAFVGENVDSTNVTISGRLSRQ